VASIPVTQLSQVTTIAAYKGPTPPAEYLREIEAIVPGGAQQILDWTRTETEHRRAIEREEQALERLAITEDVRIVRRGQEFGMAGVALCIVAALIAALTGHDTVGVALAAALVGLAGAFLAARLIGSRTSDSGSTNKKPSC